MRKSLTISLTAFPSELPARPKPLPLFEFHILSDVRKKYRFDESLFASSGNVIFPNYRAVRVFAQKMNALRDLHRQPELTVRAGDLNAMGLIDEVYHYVLRLYEETANPGVFSRALGQIGRRVRRIEALLTRFTTLFPPVAVHRGALSPEQYLAASTGSKPHREMAVEEIILLHFTNFNPAFAPFRELFDDTMLKEKSAYDEAIHELETFFRSEKKFGPSNQYIFDLLRAPILASPTSLQGQLEYIKKHWGMILADSFLKKLLGADDLLKEDMRIVAPGGTGHAGVPRYGPDEMRGLDTYDIERFTADKDWMPNVVLIAKNTYVWLDQLSKKYRRSITRLNEIPDEELDQLARWHFTGLWLIGIWERSRASQTIKQLTGNPEAVPSAYSVYDYVIAADLGGEEAFGNLAHRAWARGIRLAGDMVPNHMGIFSRWMIEHPNYFIQSDYKPFPNYQFSGPNLSDHPGIEIRIEDGYWNRRDAAVVFQRVEKSNGSVRYIYHGNDGTSMPWNDTAQLDFLKNQVREAVIHMIMHVARKFSIIRFDAAMTLTKKHFQRLWYPHPGSGGDIPSRADHAMSSEEFDKMFPQEFWREVVDRINRDLPNTLLLAEAFWLLEGYFVRTLGMHRVYNSAFMHMLMKEDNAHYRELIRNTLHYNPEILKRYVNFMSNPDEQTAIAQFGTDDKYFGVALMMVTLPGLPMFAHGQIEGYTEKYGMEYKKAYYDERPNEHLVSRHEREIFPIVSKRHLFSQVAEFELFDFVDAGGRVNENVFAYSNRAGYERAIVCYHNKFEETSGWIKISVGKVNEGSSRIRRKTLAEALGLMSGEGVHYVFRDHLTGLEYLRSARELRDSGLYLELKAFQYHLFLDFREVVDSTGEYERLRGHLNGRGVPDIQQALNALRLAPVHRALQELFETPAAERVSQALLVGAGRKDAISRAIEETKDRLRRLLAEVSSFLGHDVGGEDIAASVAADLKAIGNADLPTMLSGKGPADGRALNALRASGVGVSRESAIVFFGWLVLRRLVDGEHASRFDSLQIERALVDVFRRAQVEESRAWEDAHLLAILLFHDKLFAAGAGGSFMGQIDSMLNRREVKDFLNVHDYAGTIYFSKEKFELAAQWLLTVGIVREVLDGPSGEIIRRMHGAAELWGRALKTSEQSGYKLEVFKAAMSQVLAGVPAEE